MLSWYNINMKTYFKATIVLNGKKHYGELDKKNILEHIYKIIPFENEDLKYEPECKEDLYINPGLQNSDEEGWEKAIDLNHTMIDNLVEMEKGEAKYHEKIKIFGDWMTWCAHNMSTDTWVRDGLIEYVRFICHQFSFDEESMWIDYYTIEM